MSIIFKSMYGGCGGPTVLWHDDLNITADVTDQNIDIQGTNALVGGINVQALTCDVLITVSNVDSVITGSDNFAQLYLYAAAGRTITFDLTEDLMFRGTAVGSTLYDLLVTASGPGQIIFEYDSDVTISFASIVTGTVVESGGTVFVVGMSDPDRPEIIFRRRAGINRGGIIVGRNSIVTYIAETAVSSGGATEQGTITFDSETSSGFSKVTIQNGGAWVVFGHLLNASLSSNFTLADIDFSVPAGNLAIMNFNNTLVGASSPVQIVNENTILTQFVANPFCEDQDVIVQYGFIIGANGQLNVNDLTYLDYIGTTTNIAPVVNTPLANLQPQIVDLIECGKISGPEDVIKPRNASAFIVDGNSDPNATPAQITIGDQAAIYFRSVANCSGFVDAMTLLVNPNQMPEGAGNVIFDVEGEVDITGANVNNSALSILSLQVTPTGCPVTVDATPALTLFPQPTFARDADDNYLVYSKACWLVNARLNIYTASIVHTDVNHHVYDKYNLGYPTGGSEPAYIGGEHFKLCLPEDQERPPIRLINAMLRVHRNVASTGVDWRIPNDETDGNSSIFRFYYNGRIIDNNYGRVMVLGSNVGAFGSCYLVDNASHLDVLQDSVQTDTTAHLLTLDVAANTACITEGITGDITGQFDVQSIFLYNASNISIGGSVYEDDLVTTPSLIIGGDFFALESNGGLWQYPEASGTTGQGGMFVDTNGTVTITGGRRASIGMMVVRMDNGIIDLPRNQVLFDPRVGTTQWNITLSDPAQRILVPQGVYLSDFTMDWGAVHKDFAAVDGFVPYELTTVASTACQSPEVTTENLRALPEVHGQVDQFQIKRSRLGDQMSLLVGSGAYIRELVFLPGRNAGEAPVGFLVVQDNGYVGLGTAHRNTDSLYASIKLGVNGVTLCPNGDGVVALNENIIVDNLCHVVTGTLFGVEDAHTITLYAENNQEFRVKSTGVLDLSQFTSPTQTFAFGGNISVVFEPGARLVLGGGNLLFTDSATLNFQNIFDLASLEGTQPRDLDNVRVRASGTGIITFEENAQMFLLQNQLFSIESYDACDFETSFTILLNDQAQIHIGTDGQPGGAFQIGDTYCTAGSSVSAYFIIDGINALLEINRQGFLGFGVGIASKSSQIPNEWLVNCLSNVTNVSVDVQQGTFKHNRIVSGDDSTAALFALGPVSSLTWNFADVGTSILGGGNMVLLQSCTNNVCNEIVNNRLDDEALETILQGSSHQSREMIEEAQRMIEKAQAMIQQAIEMNNMVQIRGEHNKTKEEEIKRLWFEGVKIKQDAETILRNVTTNSINPTVQSTIISTATFSNQLFAGKYLLIVPSKGVQPSGVDAATLFNYLSSVSFTNNPTPRANVGTNIPLAATLGFVDGTQIRRDNVGSIVGPDGANTSDMQYIFEQVGAVSVSLDPSSRAIATVTEFQGAF